MRPAWSIGNLRISRTYPGYIPVICRLQFNHILQILILNLHHCACPDDEAIALLETYSIPGDGFLANHSLTQYGVLAPRNDGYLGFHLFALNLEPYQVTPTNLVILSLSKGPEGTTKSYSFTKHLRQLSNLTQ